jgi:hypothetical protein
MPRGRQSMGPIVLGLAAAFLVTGCSSMSSPGITSGNLGTRLHIESTKGVPLGWLTCNRRLVCTSMGTNSSAWSSSRSYWVSTFGYETPIASHVALGVPFVPASIACINARECILAGGLDRGRIARTADGGRHWIQVASPVKSSEFFAATCASQHLCLVVASDASSYSVDGGVSWRAGGRFGMGLGIWSADCVTNKICAGVSPPGGSPQGLYRTTDGARSWKATVLRFGDQDQLGPVSCPTQLLCVTAVQSPPPFGGLIDVTTDWIRFSDTGRTDVRSATLAHANEVHGISCWEPIACTLTAAGRSGPQWWYSVNGGRSWKLIVVPHKFTSLYGVGCASNGHCVVEAETRKDTWSLIFADLG